MSKQLSIFSPSAPTVISWELFIDGAARSNPGPAGAGVHVLKEGKTIATHGYYLGVKTNNQAEYLALLLGIYFVREVMNPRDKLTVISDSELLIKQLNGVYRVKDPYLKALYTCAQGYLADVVVAYIHVTREKNKIADKLANEGIDKKTRVPNGFISFCSTYGLTHLL